MCFDDSLCCGSCRYACCRVAIARAPNSYPADSLSPPLLHIKRSFSDHKTDEMAGFHLDVSNKQKEDMKEQMLKDASFGLYYHYFYWLEYLRTPQPWWDGDCDKCWRRFWWCFLGTIYIIIFATPIFIIGSILYIVSLIIIISKSLLHKCCLYKFTNSTLYSMHNCQLTKESGTEDDFVFNTFRLPTYLVSGTFQLFWNMARYHAGAFRTNLMTDSALLSALLTGPSARDLTMIFDDGTELSANGPCVHIDPERPHADITRFPIINGLKELRDEQKNDDKINDSKADELKSSGDESEKPKNFLSKVIDKIVTAAENVDNVPLLLNIIEEESNLVEQEVTDQQHVVGDNNFIYTSINNEKELRAHLANSQKLTKSPPQLIGYRMDFADVPKPAANLFTLLPGNFLRANSMEYKVKNGTNKFDVTIKIYDSQGILQSITRPESNEQDYETKRRRWEAAKAHVQCMLCWYGPGWSHNWVHFHLLDVAAARSPLTVSRKTVLGTLLRAHLKYVSTINVAGLAQGFPNPQSEDDCMRCLPWKGQPVTPGQFGSTVAQNTRHHYLRLNKYGLIKEGKPVFPPYWVIVRRYYGPNDPHNHPQASQFRGIIPALDFLSDYYYVIEAFVKELWGYPYVPSDKNPNLDEDERNSPPALRKSLIERDIYKQWLSDLQSNGLPGLLLPVLNRVDVITTIIWTSSIVHCSDHISYGNVFVQWPMYSSYVDFDLNQHWKDVLWNKQVHNGAYRTRETIDFFVNYRFSMFKYFTQDMLTSPGLYGDWATVEDKEKRVQLRKAHAEFTKNLFKMNERWGWYVDLKTIAASTCY